MEEKVLFEKKIKKTTDNKMETRDEHECPNLIDSIFLIGFYWFTYFAF